MSLEASSVDGFPAVRAGNRISFVNNWATAVQTLRLLRRRSPENHGDVLHENGPVLLTLAMVVRHEILDSRSGTSAHQTCNLLVCLLCCLNVHRRSTCHSTHTCLLQRSCTPCKEERHQGRVDLACLVSWLLPPKACACALARLVKSTSALMVHSPPAEDQSGPVPLADAPRPATHGSRIHQRRPGKAYDPRTEMTFPKHVASLCKPTPNIMLHFEAAKDA